MKWVDSGVALREAMKKFWDRKAAEDPYFYTTYFGPGYQGYGNQKDSEQYFEVGRKLVSKQLAGVPHHPSGNEVILEIGCGIGRMTKSFASLFGEVHAIDISSEMIAQAKANLRKETNVHFLVSNGIDLHEFEDGKFHFVYSFGVFTVLPTCELILGYVNEVGRVLKPGGVFLFQLHAAPPSLRHRLRELAVITKLRVQDSVVRLFRLGAPTELYGPFARGPIVSMPELLKVIEDSGMYVRNVERQGNWVTWMTCLRRPGCAVGNEVGSPVRVTENRRLRCA
jgi:ubiquinone/menaquinone biosynthesis C-methylase UbiE